MQHPNDLLICHQKIAADIRVHEGRWVRSEQFCSLAAFAWCFDCDQYVCEIHLLARHDDHRTQTRAEEAE